MKPSYYFMLEKKDNACLITEDGELLSWNAHDRNHLIIYADVIQELMCKIMKNEEAQEGLWIWKVRNNWQSLVGVEIEL